MGRMHTHLQRLHRVWIESPIYFVTVCTFRRRPILACDAVAAVLADELRGARERHRWAIGSYVIMPDHVHFFRALDPGSKPVLISCANGNHGPAVGLMLSGRGHAAATTFWQREFFDHILRSDQSYAQKWDYVRTNPVRAGLVHSAEDWPYTGTIADLETVK